MEVAGQTAIIHMAEHCVDFVSLVADYMFARKPLEAGHSPDPGQACNARRSDRDQPDAQRRGDPVRRCHPHGPEVKLAGWRVEG
jgi:hypothetical protein